MGIITDPVQLAVFQAKEARQAADRAYARGSTAAAARLNQDAASRRSRASHTDRYNQPGKPLAMPDTCRPVDPVRSRLSEMDTATKANSDQDRGFDD
jgi:hypothetical protein